MIFSPVLQLTKKENIIANININQNSVFATNSNSELNKNNLLNMDTISVFSCAIKKNAHDIPENSFKKILIWYKNLKKKYYITTRE